MVAMIERWKMARDKGEYAAGVLLDLSKAFDTINHYLYIIIFFYMGFDYCHVLNGHKYTHESENLEELKNCQGC